MPIVSMKPVGGSGVAGKICPVDKSTLEVKPITSVQILGRRMQCEVQGSHASPIQTLSHARQL